MPESIRVCGELTAPPARITSRSARAILRSPLCRYSTPTARVPSNRMRVDQRAGLDAQIGASERGTQIADRRAAAVAVADRHLHAAEAVLLRAVVVVGRRIPGVAPGLQIGVDQRVLVARGLDRERPVAAAIGVRAAFPALLAAEIGKHVRIGPAGQSRGGPAVVVGAISAHIRHGVDRGRAADHLAARAFDPAVVERALRARSRSSSCRCGRAAPCPRRRAA